MANGFAETLAEALKQRRWSAYDVEEHGGPSNVSIWQYIQRGRKPTLESVERIAEVLGEDVDKWRTLAGYPPSVKRRAATMRQREGVGSRNGEVARRKRKQGDADLTPKAFDRLVAETRAAMERAGIRTEEDIDRLVAEVRAELRGKGA